MVLTEVDLSVEHDPGTRVLFEEEVSHLRVNPSNNLGRVTLSQEGLWVVR